MLNKKSRTTHFESSGLAVLLLCGAVPQLHGLRVMFCPVRQGMKLLHYYIVPTDRALHEVGLVLPSLMPVGLAAAVPAENSVTLGASMFEILMPPGFLVAADAQKSSDFLNLNPAPLTESIFNPSASNC